MEQITVYTCRLGLRMFEEEEDFYASLKADGTMCNSILVNKDRIEKYGHDGLIFIDMQKIL